MCIRPRRLVFQCCAAAGVLLGISSHVFAQNSDTTPTLPELEVRPSTVDPNFDPMESSSLDRVDQSGSESLPFPSLADQLFGGGPDDITGLNSAIRSTGSIFSQSNFDTIVDREALQERMSNDMFRALQLEAGVLMQSTGRGQASPFLRGVTGQQVLLLVDGVRVNNQVLRAGPNQYFNTIDPGQVERIEVIRGSGSVLYGGDAIGGVINVVTRGARVGGDGFRQSSVRQYFGTADSGYYGRANVEASSGTLGLFGGASYTNVHDVDIGGDRGRQPFTAYDGYAGDIKLNQLIGDDTLLTFALSHFEQQDLPRSDRFAPFVFNRPGNTPRPTFFDPQQRDMAYLRWQGFSTFNDGLMDSFSMTGSYSRTKEGSRELRSPTQLDTGEFSDDVFGYTVTLQKDIEIGVLTYGAEYYHDDIDSHRSRTNPTNPAQPPQLRQPQFPNDAFADRVGGFVNFELQVTDRLVANLGTRYENVDLHATPTYTVAAVPANIHFVRTYQDWIGSVGLTYGLTDEWNLVGGVYEGWRSPTMDDLTASTTFQQNSQQNPVLASLSVQPEHSYTYEVGAKWNHEGFRMQLMQWWMNIDDFITRTVDTSGNVFLGNNRAYLYGTELSTEYLVGGGWWAYGNFASTYGIDRTSQQPVSRIPPAQGILGIRWRDDSRLRYIDFYSWLVDQQDRYHSTNLVDSRFFVDGVANTPGFGTLNLRMGTVLDTSDRHRVSLALENITDRYYRVLGSGIDGTGFNAIFGYEFVR